MGREDGSDLDPETHHLRFANALIRHSSVNKILCMIFSFCAPRQYLDLGKITYKGGTEQYIV